MTRLSEALKRAAETPGDTAVVTASEPSFAWRFPEDEAGATATAAVPPSVAEAAEPEQKRAPAPIVAATAPPSAPLASRFSADERARLVVSDDAAPALVEQYRHLAAVLHHAQGQSGYRSVMVTSALPSEGKTLTATNLALTLSESYQRRVLLIDADLRKPRLKDMCGLPDGPGLTDSLNSQRGQLPVHQITPTLWVLTAGRATADPMSTLVSGAMKQLLAEAREAFDWVVVDTPPIAILPDANLLAAMIDTALLVVSAQQTPYPMVQRAADAIGPSRILGVVLNRADAAGLSSGYGGYAYGGAAPPETPSRWSRWFRRNRGVPHVQ